MAHLRSCFLRGPLIVAVTLAASGCGDASGVGKTFPVAGRITLDGEPLTAASTVVLFKPDAAKGNASPWEPTGTVDGQGNYTLHTKGKRGAPPGWYKVVVTAFKAQADAVKGPRTQFPPPSPWSRPGTARRRRRPCTSRWLRTQAPRLTT
jgi:hypothetical protein